MQPTELVVDAGQARQLELVEWVRHERQEVDVTSTGPVVAERDRPVDVQPFDQRRRRLVDEPEIRPDDLEHLRR